MKSIKDVKADFVHVTIISKSGREQSFLGSLYKEDLGSFVMEPEVESTGISKIILDYADNTEEPFPNTINAGN